MTVMLLMLRTASATAECDTCEADLENYLGENTGAFGSAISHFGAKHKFEQKRKERKKSSMQLSRKPTHAAAAERRHVV